MSTTKFPNGIEAPIEATTVETGTLSVTGATTFGVLPTSSLNKVTALEKADSYALAAAEKTLG